MFGYLFIIHNTIKLKTKTAGINELNFVFFIVYSMTAVSLEGQEAAAADSS